MSPVIHAFMAFLVAFLRSNAALEAENAMLRHQLAIYQRRQRRPYINLWDRLLWTWVSRRWPGWRDALVFVRPATVLAWQRKRFREYWAARSHQRPLPGRPKLAKELRDLIRTLSQANPLWGSPRILGELRKLGIDVAKSTVEKYRVKTRKPPSPTWRAFLDNHVKDLVAIDFFTVPTLSFKIVFVLIVLAHDRRRVIHFNVTEHPTARWTAQQLNEAFPWDTAPRFLLRDRDTIYDVQFSKRVRSLGIEEVKTAPRSPWQNPFVERLIGSIRREVLDHIVVLNERHLKRILSQYFDYYHRWRTHLSLQMDAPKVRPVCPPHRGEVIEIADLGGLPAIPGHLADRVELKG